MAGDLVFVVNGCCVKGKGDLEASELDFFSLKRKATNTRKKLKANKREEIERQKSPYYRRKCYKSLKEKLNHIIMKLRANLKLFIKKFQFQNSIFKIFKLQKESNTETKTTKTSIFIFIPILSQQNYRQTREKLFSSLLNLQKES